MGSIETLGRRSSSDRRQFLSTILASDRRSAGDRRGGADRRGGTDRRSPKGFRAIIGQDRRIWCACPRLFSFLLPSDSILRMIDSRTTKEILNGTGKSFRQAYRL